MFILQFLIRYQSGLYGMKVDKYCVVIYWDFWMRLGGVLGIMKYLLGFSGYVIQRGREVLY